MNKLTNKPLNKLTRKTALSVLMLSSILTGCAGAQTSVKKSDSILFQVGDTVVTKQQVYDTVKYNKGVSYSIEKIKEKIEKIEVKNEDQMNKKVKKRIDILYKQYEEYYGKEESFESQIKNSGYKDVEEFKKKVLKPQVLEELLMEKYANKRIDKYLKQYKPVIAKVLAVEGEDAAKEAAKELKAGASWDDVYTKYTSENSSYQNTKKVLTTSDYDLNPDDIKVLYKNKKTGIMTKVYTPSNTDSTTRYLINVVSCDATSDEYYADFINQLKSLDSNFEKNLWKHYLKKHNFEIHDQDIFNIIRVDNPEYLYQYPKLSKENDNQTNNQTNSLQ